MAYGKRYADPRIQQLALGMKDDFGDYANNQITFSPTGMAGMPRDVKMVDVPERVNGFNRATPACKESDTIRGMIWQLK